MLWDLSISLWLMVEEKNCEKGREVLGSVEGGQFCLGGFYTKDCGCSEGGESGKGGGVSEDGREVSAGVGEDNKVVGAGGRRRRWRGVCECEVASERTWC